LGADVKRLISCVTKKQLSSVRRCVQFCADDGERHSVALFGAAIVHSAQTGQGKGQLPSGDPMTHSAVPAKVIL